MNDATTARRWNALLARRDDATAAAGQLHAQAALLRHQAAATRQMVADCRAALNGHGQPATTSRPPQQS